MNKVQSDFLDDIKEGKVAVTVFLINGVKLQGIITQQDEESLLLRRDGHTQLVYKHAVSTIMPSVAVDIAEEQPLIEVQQNRHFNAAVVCPEVFGEPTSLSPESRLAEAEGLALAIRLNVVYKESLNIKEIKPSAYFSKGFLERLKPIIAANDINIAALSFPVVGSLLAPLSFSVDSSFIILLFMSGSFLVSSVTGF